MYTNQFFVYTLQREKAALSARATAIILRRRLRALSQTHGTASAAIIGLRGRCQALLHLRFLD
jgi:hypothetical protein